MVLILAMVEVLFHCFYMQIGVKNGHPVLSVRWPLTPMPKPEVGKVYGDLVFNLGSTNTTLIQDEGINIIVDPGIIQLGRYGTFKARLKEVGLEIQDIDIVVNTHCHYDHIEANYLFRGKPLIVHEKEVECCKRLYWPEYADAFISTQDIDALSGPRQLTGHVRVIETPGHTPGSITVVAKTVEGLVACVGDAVIVKDDLLKLRPPSVVTKNIAPEVSVESLRKIASLKPVLVIPGHDAPFSPIWT